MCWEGGRGGGGGGMGGWGGGWADGGLGDGWVCECFLISFFYINERSSCNFKG